MADIIPFLLAHWILSSAFLVVLIVIVVVELIQRRNQVPQISTQQAVYFINRENAIVVDIRKQDAYVRGHIIHSVHMPLSELTQDVKKLIEYRQKPIIIVCGQGQESAKAAAILEEQDFEQVKILRGGLQAWRADNLPVVKN